MVGTLGNDAQFFGESELSIPSEGIRARGPGGM